MTTLSLPTPGPQCSLEGTKNNSFPSTLKEVDYKTVNSLITDLHANAHDKPNKTDISHNHVFIGYHPKGLAQLFARSLREQAKYASLMICKLSITHHYSGHFWNKQYESSTFNITASTI